MIRSYFLLLPAIEDSSESAFCSTLFLQVAVVRNEMNINTNV